MTQATQGTDIEDWIAKLLTKDLTEVKVGVAALRKADLEVAASGLGTILEINSVILEIENDDKRNDEFEGFLRRAETVVDNAELVFAKVETTEEKIRAMEIIDELEPVKRGVYGGAVGYLSFNGNMDTAIAIRTAVIKDNTLHIQAGAGVVADSIPRLEWKETMNKGRAIFRAVAMTYNDYDH